MTAGHGQAAPRAVPGWAPTDKTIHRTFHTGTFDAGVAFINDLAKLAAAADHHPDVILTYKAVIITLTTHDEGRVTDKDVALAEQINRLWDEHQQS